MTENKTYLGDGAYAQCEGDQVVLRTQRAEGEHFIALEPEVLMAFLRFVARVHGVRITVEPSDDPGIDLKTVKP